MTSEFLLELLSEEIPARMQLKAADDLKQALVAKLAGIGLSHGEVRTFVTPRRLTAVIENLAGSTEPKAEERRGPKMGAPEQAIDGFLKSAGVTIDQCQQRDGYWYVVVRSQACPAVDLLPNMVREIIREFSWAKSMRWAGAAQTWVRPLRGVMALLGGQPLKFTLPDVGLESSSDTVGHRFLSTGRFAVSDFKDYQAKLEKAFVILDHHARQKLIQEKLNQLGAQRGYVLEEDSRLLEEVAGLAEYPQTLIGKIDERFMRLPKAVLSTSMRVHQKYFTFVDREGSIAPIFGLVANTVPSDDGAIMLRGYERVLMARLSDAAFFYDHDLAHPLVDNASKLDAIVYHAKLGSLGQRVARLKSLVESIGAQRAAELCKCDLVSSMVGEFPELQGIMGQIYADAQGEPKAVAQAIREHYQPLGPQDYCPTAEISVELALAEKIDILVGFFAIGEIPTGSKDPYALRRAALGVIRLLRENRLVNYPLMSRLIKSLELYRAQGVNVQPDFDLSKVMDFILERLSHALKAEGIRHDAITAVFNTEHGEEDIWSLGERARALNDYLSTDSGEALQAAFRRANGILAKDGASVKESTINVSLFKGEAEQDLYEQLSQVHGQCRPLLERHDFKGLMKILADLREPIDRFFDLKINDDDQAVRTNRFAMLRLMVQQTNLIADFTQLEG